MRQLTDRFRAETTVAVDAITRALDSMRSGDGRVDVALKGVRDVVTETDIAVEDAVRGLVSKALGWSVVGEERGGEPSADGSPYWLLDPICGTRNFAYGIPFSCVNLALVEEDQVTAAIVGDPQTARSASQSGGEALGY
jgi:fructose-1,6-bisphosphatase/inositol monophosphatase family enzyme